LPEFLDAYPEVEVELVLSDRIVDLVDDKVDVALRISRGLPDSNLIARKLFQYQRVICASPKYLRASSNPTSPRDLEKHECLTFHAGGGLDFGRPGGKVWNFRRGKSTEAVTVDGRMDSNSLSALTGAALNGFGLFLVPKWMVDGYLKRGDLEIVLGEYEVDPSDEETWVYAVYASNRFLSPKVRVFDLPPVAPSLIVRVLVDQ
jgi:DNA-binding transcriptional LysR family regulator